jgi:hypothetical protein
MSVDLSAVRLLVATPAYNGVSNNYFHATHALRGTLNKLGIYGQFVTAPGMPVDAARDFIGNAFLSRAASKEPFTHVLMCDSDIGFPASAVLRMIERDVDFVTAAPPLRRYDWKGAEKALAQPRNGASLSIERLASLYAVKLLGDTLSVDNRGFARIDQVGGAFMLLRPRVFEAIRDAHPELRHKGGVMFFQPAVMDGERKGEDVAFCRRWRATGGDIWLLVDVPLTHEGPHTFEGSYADLTTLGTTES